MDYCECGDLASRIGLMSRRRRVFEEEQALLWTTQALLALEYIHSRNIIHCDVKPGNIFITKTGSVQLGDFGVAKALASNTDRATAQVGTPSYLSPEVCQGRQYNCSSDMWAMGCVMYELFTLRVLFEATSLPALMEHICQEPIRNLKGLCSEDAEELCMAMLERDPEIRLSARSALRSSVLDVYAEMEEDFQRCNSAKRLCDSRRCAVMTESPVTPYREGDEVDYLSETSSQWIRTNVIAVSSRGCIRVASCSDAWIGKTAQVSRVRLVRLSDGSTLNLCHKRSSPPRLMPRATPRDICEPAPDCGASHPRVSASALKSSDMSSDCDVCNKHEVAARLLGYQESIKKWGKLIASC